MRSRIHDPSLRSRRNGPPELIVLLVLTIFLGIPIAIGTGTVKLVTGGRTDDERIAELEQRVGELETEQS